MQIITPALALKRLASVTVLQGKCVLRNIPSDRFLLTRDKESQWQCLVAHFCCSPRLQNGQLPIPVELERFILELRSATTRTPNELGYTESAGKVIHSMLPKFGKNLKQVKENTPAMKPGYREFSERHEWLLRPRPFQGDNHLLTLLHNTKEFYNEQANEKVPISGRNQLPWCYELQKVRFGDLAVQSVKDKWQHCICPENDPAAMRASSILSDLKDGVAHAADLNLRVRSSDVVVIDNKLDENGKDFTYSPCAMSNTIFISKQYLQDLTPCKDTLAFVLGHELAHIIANHNAESLCYKFFSVLVIEDIADILEYAHRTNIWSNELLHKKLEVAGKCVTNFLPSPTTHEHEADILAMHIMAHAGYNLKKVPDFVHDVMGKNEPDRDFEPDAAIADSTIIISSETAYRRVQNLDLDWKRHVDECYTEYAWETLHPANFNRGDTTNELADKLDPIRNKALRRKDKYYNTKSIEARDKITQSLKDFGSALLKVFKY